MTLRERVQELIYDLRKCAKIADAEKMIEAWYLATKRWQENQDDRDCVDWAPVAQRDTRCMVCGKAPCTCSVP